MVHFFEMYYYILKKMSYYITAYVTTFELLLKILKK